jgi:Leucine-rich repeat (LRR) protein
MTTPACGKHTRSEYDPHDSDSASKRQAPSTQEERTDTIAHGVRHQAPLTSMGLFEQLPVEVVYDNVFLGNVPVRDLGRMRRLNKLFQAAVDASVQHSLRQLIKRYRNQDSGMLDRLGLPHDPTQIEDPWTKLRALCQDNLQIPQTDLQTIPLTTLFSPKHINQSLQIIIDQTTIALKQVLCEHCPILSESSPKAFSDLQRLTEVSHIRDWCKNHQRLLCRVDGLDLREQNLFCMPPEIRLFESLTELALSNNPLLNHLDKNIFNRLSKLTHLYLDKTGITEIPPGCFDKLTNLQELHLGPTRITEIPPECFDQLTNLQALNLNLTGITEIPPGCFDKLTNLQRLYLNHNGITEIPPECFDQLTNLTQLYLHTTGITEIPSGVFDKLTKLQALNLCHTGITKIPSGCFDKLTNLTYLYLQNTKITEIPSGVFDKLTNLRELNLSQTGITEIPSGVFDKLTKLQALNLSQTGITEIPSGVFDKLTNLRELNLSQTGITKIPPGLVDKLTKLHKLDLPPLSA